jgi:hypothetical protein
MITQKFQKKPLIVEAIQVTAENFLEVANWCSGEVTEPDGTPALADSRGDQQYIHVRVLNPMHERQTKAFIGDWVLYAGRGFKVYKDRAFRGTFLPLQAEDRDKATQHEKQGFVNPHEPLNNPYGGSN